MEILEFIFSDFWHWLGTLIMLSIIAMIPKGMIVINKEYNGIKENDK